MNQILRAEKITKEFSDQELVLKGISVSIAEGSFTVILGQSGSGKTTLLGVMSGLLKPTSGKIWYQDKKINEMSEAQLADWKRAEIGHIFQNYLLLNNDSPQNILPFGIAPYNDGSYARMADIRIFQYDYNLMFLEEYFKYKSAYEPYPYPWSVSSMSPVTVGFVAILKSINNDLPPEEYKEILMKTSYSMNYKGPVESDNGYCSNIADIGKAVEYLKSNY